MRWAAVGWGIQVHSMCSSRAAGHVSTGSAADIQGAAPAVHPPRSLCPQAAAIEAQFSGTQQGVVSGAAGLAPRGSVAAWVYGDGKGDRWVPPPHPPTHPTSCSDPYPADQMYGIVDSRRMPSGTGIWEGFPQQSARTDLRVSCPCSAPTRGAGCSRRGRPDHARALPVSAAAAADAAP